MSGKKPRCARSLAKARTEGVADLVQHDVEQRPDAVRQRLAHARRPRRDCRPHDEAVHRRPTHVQHADDGTVELVTAAGARERQLCPPTGSVLTRRYRCDSMIGQSLVVASDCCKKALSLFCVLYFCMAAVQREFRGAPLPPAPL